jgi:hypothetical protein
MNLTLPTMWSLAVASLTVASVWANTFLESSEMTTEVDPSSSRRHLSGRGSSCTGQVSRWELIDTTTNTKVMDLANGNIVYSDNPSFSIRAVVSGSGTRSVSLTLNSGFTNTENTAHVRALYQLGRHVPSLRWLDTWTAHGDWRGLLRPKRRRNLSNPTHSSGL